MAAYERVLGHNIMHTTKTVYGSDLASLRDTVASLDTKQKVKHSVRKSIPNKAIVVMTLDNFDINGSCKSNISCPNFFSPPAHLCAVTYNITEISLNVTLSNLKSSFAIRVHFFDFKVNSESENGCLTSHATIFQLYMWRHVDGQADWRS